MNAWIWGRLWWKLMSTWKGKEWWSENLGGIGPASERQSWQCWVEREILIYLYHIFCRQPPCVRVSIAGERVRELQKERKKVTSERKTRMKVCDTRQHKECSKMNWAERWLKQARICRGPAIELWPPSAALKCPPNKIITTDLSASALLMILKF